MKSTASVFKSLEDENRLRILGLLLEVREICVCDFMTILQMPQSTVSRQLSILKKAGWLADRKEALWIHYSINSTLEPLQQSLLPVLHHFIHDDPTAKSDLTRYLTHKKDKCCS